MVNVDNSKFIKGMTEATAEQIQTVYKRMQRVGNHVMGEAQRKAPSDTGQLRGSMITNTKLDNRAIVTMVGNTAEYAPYVHQGTGIYATNGKGRKKPWLVKTIYKGKPVYFWTVGIKPNRFLKDAVEKSKGAIEEILEGR